MINEIDYQKYVDVLIEDLQALVRIPSVRNFQTASETRPYGEIIGQALDLMIQKSKRDGFTTKEIDGRAIVIEPSQNGTGKRIDLISHVDVVGIGPNWTYEPFGATIDDNKMYGRGTSDMKRNALLTYYAMKIIQDQKLPLKNQLRVVLGTDEENEMDDMRYYVEKEGAPDFAFTPDGTFPLAIGEKGAVTFELQGSIPDQSRIISIDGGEADNVVPSSVVVHLKETDPQPIIDYRNEHQLAFEFDHVEPEGYLAVTVHGKGAHASTPEIGENAITAALKMVNEVYYDDFAGHLKDLFHAYDGSGLDLATETEEMGPLTNNLGVIKTDSTGGLVFTVDFRFPNSTTSIEIEAQLMAKLADFDSKRIFDTPAVMQDIKRPALQLLMNTFKEHYPNHSQEPIVSGGVTYSKVVPNCVSFGATFETDPHVAHQADEFVRMDTLPALLKLYTEAIIKLAQAEDI